MNPDIESRIEKLREDIDEYEARLAAIEDLRDEVLEADSIGETRLSGLFHEARTNRPDDWSTATAFVTVEDGEARVEEVSKLRDGRWTPETRSRYDHTISVGIRPFMESDDFRGRIRGELSQAVQGLTANIEMAREQIQRLERGPPQ